MSFKNWKKGKDYPSWMSNEALITLSKGYLIKNETPRDMYKRVASSVAVSLDRADLEDKFFDYMWKGWLCPASPVLSNMGTDRGLPISCFGISIGDSLEEIYDGSTELAMMTKNGGGVGICLSNIRGRGVPIKGGENGYSEGVVPWAKRYDTDISATNQGNTRRGAASVNLHCDHVDLDEFLKIRRPQGDANRQCLNLHHCVQFTDQFMIDMLEGDQRKRNIWQESMKSRLETGEPFCMFLDNVNKVNPPGYKKLGLEVEMTNICSEITLFTDALHNFICCLSSLNLAKWEEWKDSDLVETTVWFLNGVLDFFINKASSLYKMEKSVASAIKGRAIGIGVLGWHSLLQSEMTAMGSFRASILNRAIFKAISERSIKASKEMAAIYGEPEWCKGTGMYNSHLQAIAPTRTNALIAGNKSQGIEPWTANAFTDETAKGTFIRRNEELEKLLETKGMNTDDVWKSIVDNRGSVLHLDCLSKEEKEVFLTAYEIDQMVLVNRAAERQPYIDQAQSLNLFFTATPDPLEFHRIHVEAWRKGLKTLYYVKSNSVLKADQTFRKNDVKEDECTACEG
jgi:ribonucleoside-diphosphate reductase alpha chain